MTCQTGLNEWHWERGNDLPTGLNEWHWERGNDLPTGLNEWRRERGNDLLHWAERTALGARQ